MSAQELATKYIALMEKTLKSARQTEGPIAVSKECMNEMYGYVKAYLDDARYFLTQGKFETSLVSIAYCEGLLDALKLMGGVSVPQAENPQ